MSVNSNIIFQSSIIKKIAVPLLCIIAAFLLSRFITSYNWIIVVGGAIFIPFIVFFFMRPKIGLLGFIATDFLLGFTASSFLSSQSFVVTAVRFIGFIVFAGWIVRIVSKSEEPKLVNAPQNIILLLYFLASIVSALFSEYPINGLLDLQTLSMQILLYFLVMSMVDSPEMVGRIVWSIVLVGVASTIVGMYQLIFLSVVRLGGMQINPNAFSIANIIFLSLILFQFHNLKSIFSKVILGILAAFIVFSIVASGSRAGLITLGLTIVLFLIQSAHRPKDVLKGILALSIMGLALLVIVNSIELPTFSKRRILDIPSPLSFFMNPLSIENRSSRQRAIQIQVAKEILSSHPILGIGPRSYIMEEDQYFAQLYNYERGHGTAPHNIYIALLTEHGILGTALFLCLIGLTLRDFRIASSVFKKQGNSTLLNWTRGIELSYISFLFFGLSSATGLRDKYLFVAIALAPVLRKIATTQEEGNL